MYLYLWHRSTLVLNKLYTIGSVDEDEKNITCGKELIVASEGWLCTFVVDLKLSLLSQEK